MFTTDFLQSAISHRKDQNRTSTFKNKTIAGNSLDFSVIELRGSFNEKWPKFQVNFIQEIDLIIKLKAQDTEQTIF